MKLLEKFFNASNDNFCIAKLVPFLIDYKTIVLLMAVQKLFTSFNS